MLEEHSGVVIPVPPNPPPPYAAAVAEALAQRRALFDAALAHLSARARTLAEAAGRIVATLAGGCKILVAGNGGSAAEAQHFAAELVGRFKRERRPYAALALTADSALLTAVANDYGYADVFARQIHGLGQPGDLFIAFSTSGESENLIRAAAAARERGMAVVGICGDRACRLADCADVAVHVPLVATDIVQELQMAVTHILCDIVETALAAREGAAG